MSNDLGFSRFRRILLNASMNGVGQVAPMLLGVFAVPILIKGLGVERFGLLTLSWTLIGVFALFDFGLGRAITQSVSSALASGRHEDVEEIFDTGLISILMLGLIAGVLLWVLANPIASSLKIQHLSRDELIWSIRIVAMGLPTVTLMSGVKGFLESMDKFRFLNLHRVFLGIANFVLPITIMIWTKYVPMHIASLILIRLISLFLQLHFASRLVQRSVERKRYSCRRVVDMLKFGGWMTASNVISPVMVYLDRFFIGSMLGLGAVTVYATLVDALTRILVIPNSLISAVFPVMSGMISGGNRGLREVFVKSICVIGIVMVPIVLVGFVFAPEILKLWLGAEFSANGSAIFRILLVGILVNSFSAMPYALLQAAGRPDVNAKIHIVELPLYLLSAYFFAIYWGLIGVAFAWSLRIVIDAVVLFLFGNRMMRCRPCLVKASC